MCTARCMWLAPRSTKSRGPCETEIQARFTPIRVLTQAVKTVAYLRGSTAQQDVRSQHPRQQTNRGEASFPRD